MLVQPHIDWSLKVTLMSKTLGTKVRTPRSEKVHTGPNYPFLQPPGLVGVMENNGGYSLCPFFLPVLPLNTFLLKVFPSTDP